MRNLLKNILLLGISLILGGCYTEPKSIKTGNIRQDVIVRGKGAPNCGSGDNLKITTRDGRVRYLTACKLTSDFVEACIPNGIFAPKTAERIAIKDIAAIERSGRDTMPCFPAVDFGGFGPRM